MPSPSEYGEEYVTPNIFRGMLKESKEPSLLGNLYDLEGRLEQANLPEEYSFEEMNYPLGGSDAADYDINILDIIEQRNLLNFLVDKSQKSPTGDISARMPKEEVDEALGALNKLSHIIATSKVYSEADRKKQKDIAKKELDALKKQFPKEFD
tara:strand:- start:120 stop:578 length:459 start_codon:yes stop_codon:yes gene_type:complete